MFLRSRSQPFSEDKFQGNVAFHVRNLWKTYRMSGAKVHALRGVSFDITSQEVVAIQGASGSGKTTLLNLLAGIDQPTLREGTVLNAFNVSLLNRSETWYSNYRARIIGFVLQFFGLLPTLNVLENVLLAGYFSKIPENVRYSRAVKLLERLGLGDRLQHFPSELSGGEQQRVAIARALIHEPRIILADEPTGNLDSKTGKAVMNLLLEMAREKGITVLIVTHDSRVAQLADRIVMIDDGVLIDQGD